MISYFHSILKFKDLLVGSDLPDYFLERNVQEHKIQNALQNSVNDPQ